MQRVLPVHNKAPGAFARGLNSLPGFERQIQKSLERQRLLNINVFFLENKETSATACHDERTALEERIITPGSSTATHR